MKVGFLGSGTWGVCLAQLLANKGISCLVWSAHPEKAELLQMTRRHPKLHDLILPDNLRFTSELKEVLQGSDLIVESVTSAGIRPVFEQIKTLGGLHVPVAITSKGIEQKSELLLDEVILNVLGSDVKPLIGVLSGPSLAEEVLRNVPTSVVSAAYDPAVMMLIQNAFSTATFRVYPNSDVHGVLFGGAMKNIVAIACGLSDGLGFGMNTKAAIMTRGLHEMRKLGVVKGCRIDTLNGLAGMGDLCATCLSTLSRNYRFGNLLAHGDSAATAKEKIHAAVEGAYTCVSALQMGQHYNVPLPITQAIYDIIYADKTPLQAVRELMQRMTKEEHL